MKEKCKNCVRPSKACIAYLMTISTRETLEWCKMWKDRFGWSNATLAEKSNVPIGTINRIFSHAKTEDDAAGVKLATIRPVICAITGCTLEELEACEGLHTQDHTNLLERNKELKEEIERAVKQQAFLAEQIKRKDRYVAIFASLLLIAVLIIIAALVVDILHPEKGFFWFADAIKGVTGSYI